MTPQKGQTDAQDEGGENQRSDALYKVVEADMRYGAEDDELWEHIKLFALRRKVSDDKLKLKDLPVIQNYVDQEYTV